MECDYESCGKKAGYCIEWWGVDQEGKNPEVVGEHYSCFDPKHLLDLSYHDEFGGYPDGIFTVSTNPMELTGKPRNKLLFFVKQAMNGKLDKGTLDRLVMIADPPKEQLTLFPWFRYKKRALSGI